MSKSTIIKDGIRVDSRSNGNFFHRTGGVPNSKETKTIAMKDITKEGNKNYVTVEHLVMKLKKYYPYTFIPIYR